MVFYAAYSISRRHLTYSCIVRVSSILGWDSELSCPKTLQRKTQRIINGLNPGCPGYESNTLNTELRSNLTCYKQNNNKNMIMNGLPSEVCINLINVSLCKS